MKKFNLLTALIALLIVFFANGVFAGPPLTNLEGVGGIAFNPLAYPADSGGDGGQARFGAWYVALGTTKVDWTSLGIAETLFKKLEISYGYETINQDSATAKHKSNLGAKLVLLPENGNIPAVSVGTILKKTNNAPAGVDASGADFYLVATKLFTQLPQPVLLSGGALSTKGRVTGVFGYDKDTAVTLFGNVDVILPLNLIAGFEYKQGANYSDWHDADYWNTHLAWTPNNNLSLVLAYVNAGDNTSTSTVGLSDGLVLSTQYAF
jgi:Protein of unknown function (DUF3034)